MNMDTPMFRKNQVSYLQARDPSIIAGYINLEAVKTVLAKTKFQECSSIDEIPECIQVYLRIKKAERLASHYYELIENRLICHFPEKKTASKEYIFDKIFGPKSAQEDLFNGVIKPKLFHFINGNSSTLLTYGTSGSGKTFTMFGTTVSPGIIPRAFEYLFRTLSYIPEDVTFKPDCNGDVIFLSQSGLQEERNNSKRLLNYFSSAIDNQHLQTYRAMQQRLTLEPVGIVDNQPDVMFGVWVSFAEIYNENIYDLLKPKPARGEPRRKLTLGTFNGQTFIKNLTSINVTSGLEAYQILQYGLHNLKYAETSVNLHSSRSHSIFTIKLLQGSRRNKQFTVSFFNFCDLAGSERVKKTLNMGERLKESNYINTSLHVLGRCIKSLRESQKTKDNKLIPFRESKLTLLFQHALLGLEDIALIININPDVSMFDETQHVLGFSVNAKEVRVTAKENVKAKERRINSNWKERIQKLRDTVASLQLELEEQKERHKEEERIYRMHTIAEIHESTEKHSKSWAGHLKEVNELCKSEYIRKLEEAKNEYIASRKQNNITLNNKNSTIVIQLDSSDSE